MELRQASAKDVPEIRRLVIRIVSEVYGHLLPDGVPEPDEPWEMSQVAEVDGRICGVVLTGEDRVEDLWVEAAWRGRGLGATLLAAAEREIGARGYEVAGLHVVAENHRALAFYEANGWTRLRSYPHEHTGFPMIEMTKALTS